MGQHQRTPVLCAQLALFPLLELQLVRAAAQARIFRPQLQRRLRARPVAREHMQTLIPMHAQSARQERYLNKTGP